MSVSPGFLAPDAFAFAFPHAINLAEAGGKIDDKRIGHSCKQAGLRMVVNVSNSRIPFLLGNDAYKP